MSSGRKVKRSQEKKPPVKIGKYMLLEKLGVGGFGVVRKAVNEQDGSIVAIKILDKAELQLQDMTQHAKREIALLTMINHPNIVRGYEVLSSKTKLFLVMEYVDGGDLHSALASKGKFPEKEAREMFSSLITCLDYCHRQGIYHRDLKLENILLTSSGQLKICDFGLASVRALRNDENDLCRTIVGTEDFSSPEVLQNIPYNGDKADMWSAGILLFAMLAGYCPFRSGNPRELQEKIIRCRYTFPKGFPDAPKGVIKRLLVPRGNDRLSASEALRYEWVSNHSSLQRGKETDHVENDLVEEVTNASKPQISSLLSTQSRPRVLRKKISKDSSSREYVASVERPGRSLYMALGRATVANFPSLLDAMQHPATGIQVQNRRWRWKVFENCFVATDAVSWLTGHVGCSREAAVELGQQLLDAGAIHHVCREHEFEEGFLFFRWIDNEPENALTLNMRKICHKPVFPPNPTDVSIGVLTQLLELCKSYQAPHDYQMVALPGVQSDKLLKDFMNAVTELQVVNINSLLRNEQKISFLVNVHNLLWFQARIHIGDFEEMGFYALRQRAMSLQYNIAGVRISLSHISELLFGCDDMSNIGTDMRRVSSATNISIASDRTGSKGGSSVITKLIPGKRHDSMQVIHEALKPERSDPMVHFITSDGSPQSPIIRGVTEKEITVEYMRQAAAEYLDLVLELNAEACIVSYPPKVARFREICSHDDNESFLNELIRICAGRAVCSGLQAVQKRSREEKIPLKVVAKEESELPYSLTCFAPRIGRSLSLASTKW